MPRFVTGQRAFVVMAMLMAMSAGLLSMGQSAPAPAPASAPSKPKPTPEQQAILDRDKAAISDKPFPKIDTNPLAKDGAPNPNYTKVSPSFRVAHERNLKRKEQPIGLLFIGDSITAGWSGKGRQIWDERYGKFNAANFGIGGDRTEHVLWRIENGELDGISPKVVVLMIGTNNVWTSNPEQIIAGVKAVVAAIRAKLPDSKLLLLGVFPRSQSALVDGKPEPRRAKLMAVNPELAKLDDGQNIFYLEIWKPFLNEDGTIDKEVMHDFLHLTEKGYKIWADAMQPKLDELMK